MTVTKQQQLEWLVGFTGGCYVITQEEWQQERDKMQKQQDNSLSKRGSCPPIGEQVELWFGGSFAYNCEFICMRGRNYIVWNLDADRPDCADIMNSEFRPLRTEREKAIDDLIEIICSGGELSKDGSASREIAEHIYDAGYRKQ